MLPNSRWILFQEAEQTQHGPLSYFETWKFISKLKREELNKLYASNANSVTRQWFLVEDIECFQDLIRRKRGELDGIEPTHTLLAQLSKLNEHKIRIRKPKKGDDPFKAKVLQLNSGTKLLRDRRQHVRFPLAFPLNLKSGNETAHCHSLNISLGGALLSDKLPESSHGKIIELTLIAQSDQHELQVTLSAKILSQHEGPSRLVFEDMPEHKRSHLRQVIHDQLQGYLQVA